MAKREISEINAGSMADIAFLLLIFFLVTTTMDTDTGLIRKLPPPPEDNPEDIDVKQRNIFEVLVNANDQLLVEGDYIQVSELRAKAKEFIKGDKNNPEMPEFKIEEVPVFGQMEVSKQIISLQNDNGTSYEMYIKVQNELIGAYSELRNELANQKFGKSYDELVAQSESSELIGQQYKAIKAIYPQRISEAEPKAVGGAN
ncbi:biopolymer transporter ExbD [Vicingus serpentipes]|jgi:biopolymer transport protein ExbD|uniref:Biopolymer transporter ExbD n=1 Tax=Vicingus serpentipes TaxID=1926625 RepID=A0A5C6RRN1_9FLAO|nr:biopolymer transporter ExbD [Vicingus serpentipes]TXB64649.1 biopolymer transporter ExbD [Vicingus serpentipes]